MIQKQPCALGKNHQPLFPRNEKKIKVKHLGEFYHVDACVMSIKSHGEAKCFLLQKNDHNFYKVLYCMKSKEKIVQHFEHLCIEFKANELKILQIDKRGEFILGKSNNFLKERHSSRPCNCVYT
jgi:hypothetical protein